MAMLNIYRDYFDIDPEYFPQVNEAIINKNPDIWKKFYPHDTFVKLIKDTISVISRKQKVSIWVEGAYGTGKSHAVLTLKKLLDASDKDTKEYFDKYKDQLSMDLYNQFRQLKNGDEKILTVHRYGSSSIHNDDNLVSAIQESISHALVEAGINNSSTVTLKDSIVQWLSQPWAKSMFNDLLKEEYSNLFSGEDVDAIINKLNSYTGEGLQELIGKIMRVGDEKQFKALKLSVDDLVKWIKDIIEENNLKAIVFIWDEFTEYFRNNMRSLTGFQKIVDISGSDPFYMLIVTHNVTHIFPETDNDWKKILDRFIKPLCNIELPENMAIRLMGAAMEKNADPQIQSDWNETTDELYDRTSESRELVKNKAHISDSELKAILPIHPYTALLLKHISTAFDSNQRSMFDFIKNDRGDEIKGFQWFIDNYGPLGENPLLTIDMLWDFFYEKGKEYLSNDIRTILDTYYLTSTDKLGNDDKRVLKTVLLLQAISRRTGDTVELFIPNEKNVNNAFEGSDLDNGTASHIADSLTPNILFKKPMSGGKFQYSALINASNTDELKKYKDEQMKKVTSALVGEGDISSAITLTGALNLRYKLEYVTVTDFKSKLNALSNSISLYGNKIIALIAFAKNDTESITISKYIQDAVDSGKYNFIFIDASTTPLGNDLMVQYAEAMANSLINIKQDKGLAAQYDSNAKDVLKSWKKKISEGQFVVYTNDKPQGERVTTIDLLYTELSSINKKRYPNGLENGASVTETMWQANSLPMGVSCGAVSETSGQYRSGNPQTKLERYIGTEAWNVEKYWETSPTLYISKLKVYVDKIISDAFKKDGRIAIEQIYDSLKTEPYGFMPCNLTSFVLGFILKEYVDGTYSWSDGLTTDILTVDKLKEMVSEIIKHNITPIPRYKSKYIVALTNEEKAFNESASKIFKIPSNLCTSIEHTRDYIRKNMKELAFPIWSLKYLLDETIINTDKDKIITLIDYFNGIANTGNYVSQKTESQYALDIGKLCIDNKYIVSDMVNLVSKENCIKGMMKYLQMYSNGELITLSSEIGDGGNYIHSLKKKFDADAANWVWNIDTANKKIDELILEYRIIVESNKILSKNISYHATISEWCDKCSYIRISYLYARNNWGSLLELMSLLYNMKRADNLSESSKQKFLDEIMIHGIEFNDFYNNQTKIFKEICSFILQPFSDEEIAKIFSMLPCGLFVAEKSSYQATVQNIVNKFTSEQGSVKLKKLWKDNTNTENPRDWSIKYITPILCMVDDKDVQKAKAAFNTFLSKEPSKESVEKTIEFLNNTDIFNKLNDKDARDKAFSTSIIKSYCILLDNVDEVRKYLLSTVNASVYDWFGLPEIDKHLKLMAEYKYNASGCDKALEKIDSMNVADVKRYLKELIRDNMIVGMEIIKDN